MNKNPITALEGRSREVVCLTRGLAFPCWVAQKVINTTTGYAQVYSEGQARPAHRVAYQLLIADIPPGLDLDHLCRVRPCWNPWHMDPVTRAVNLQRGRTGHRMHLDDHGVFRCWTCDLTKES